MIRPVKFRYVLCFVLLSFMVFIFFQSIMCPMSMHSKNSTILFHKADLEDGHLAGVSFGDYDEFSEFVKTNNFRITHHRTRSTTAAYLSGKRIEMRIDSDANMDVYFTYDVDENYCEVRWVNFFFPRTIVIH